MNKNKKVLAIFRAKSLAKKYRKENPDWTEEEITEKVINELFGEDGLKVLEEVKQNPGKYESVLKDLNL